MKTLLTDPVVLICCAIIIVGIFGLFWGIAKFKRMKSASLETAPVDDFMPTAPLSPDLDFRAPSLSPQTNKVAAVSGPVSKDVADRLESMTQRLAEMQTVLMKQSSTAAAGGTATPGGVGQGFSPETIDKLLKIIGNVIQQVDILQKNLNVP